LSLRLPHSYQPCELEYIIYASKDCSCVHVLHHSAHAGKKNYVCLVSTSNSLQLMVWGIEAGILYLTSPNPFSHGWHGACACCILIMLHDCCECSEYVQATKKKWKRH